ncbi:hypothetical protein DFP73DRAFT_588786 [Morchella snyderi]|nr:hypothetical protein DFP73DRAFT_588786 [Morchella snyderi]
MTLRSETVSLLRRAIDILDHHMSPTQHALHSPDERRSMLLQLTVATEAAAKLADIIHMEAVAVVAQQNTSDGEAERIRAETERLKAEAEKIKAETERTRAEGEKVGMEAGRSAADAAKISKEVERVVAETERTRAEVEKVVTETQRMRAEAEKVGKEAERSVADTERTKMEIEKVEKEVERAAQETEKIKVEAVRVGKELERVMAETERKKAEDERLSSETRYRTPTVTPAEVPNSPNTVDLSPSPITPIRGIPVPESTQPLITDTVITGLYKGSPILREIADAAEAWNSSNTEIYTHSEWAWFRHSEMQAFLFLNRPGNDYSSLACKIRERTGNIKIPRRMSRDFDTYSGYDGFLHGRTREDGSRETVRFE